MSLNIRRRANAAVVAYQQGRAESLAERDEREEREQFEERARAFKQLVQQSPQGVWFPSDGGGGPWTPSFFEYKRRG